jgi:hypothetical protein
MNNKDINTIKELLNEIIVSAYQDEVKLKELDKSIDPSSYGRTVHLVKTLIEYINEKE